MCLIPVNIDQEERNKLLLYTCNHHQQEKKSALIYTVSWRIEILVTKRVFMFLQCIMILESLILIQLVFCITVRYNITKH